ncbi:MAG: KamA family radical SAM protein, partial [Phycisphaeraceae bacterium]|nr:KamA family radical SAM protein [Phycisphaeraceae bacterium]
SRELHSTGLSDPLSEEKDSPVRCICHRYPDRALLYVSAMCAMYCRFCTRKRKVGDPRSVHWDNIQAGIEYIREHEEIRDVIISGGDPLLLDDMRLKRIISKIRLIPHVEIIRIGTRVPVTLPQRITPSLCHLLSEFHPLFINTHFNHPWEITPQSRQACARLADAGIPLGNQSVLLKGVNDSPQVMRELMQKLLTLRVKPYYIYQADLVKGTDHFRTPLQQGLDIMASLRGFTSGLAVPHFVIDAPGGGGKIAIIPDPVVSYDANEICLKNFEGALYHYPTSAPKENQ